MELKLTCQNTKSFYAEQTVYLLIQKITRYRLESSTQIYIFFIYMKIFYYCVIFRVYIKGSQPFRE